MDRRIRKSFSSLLMSELLNRQPGFKRSFLIQKGKKEKGRKMKCEQKKFEIKRDIKNRIVELK